MAFVDFHQAPASAPVIRIAAGRVQAEPLFTPLEARVIALARSDGLWSIRPRGVLDRVLKTAFGLSRPNLLADPRLEALRRFAVIVRRGDDRRVRRETAQFLANGFERRHAAAVLELAGA